MIFTFLASFASVAAFLTDCMLSTLTLSYQTVFLSTHAASTSDKKVIRLSKCSYHLFYFCLNCVITSEFRELSQISMLVGTVHFANMTSLKLSLSSEKKKVYYEECKIHIVFLLLYIFQ